MRWRWRWRRGGRLFRVAWGRGRWWGRGSWWGQKRRRRRRRRARPSLDLCVRVALVGQAELGGVAPAAQAARRLAASLAHVGEAPLRQPEEVGDGCRCGCGRWRRRRCRSRRRRGVEPRAGWRRLVRLRAALGGRRRRRHDHFDLRLREERQRRGYAEHCAEKALRRLLWQLGMHACTLTFHAFRRKPAS